jgi:integrase
VPRVRLIGLEKATRRLKGGRTVVYWYAWRGGPRLPGQPGSPEFMAAYNAAVADRKTPKAETLTALVARYRASPEWGKLADATKAEWSRWLDRIAADATNKDIGGLTFRALDDRRVRADLLEWRDQWGDRPRAADYAMQVLGRVLSWAVGRGLLTRNAAEGVEQLYAGGRADQVWTSGEIDRFVAAAKTPEVGFIVRLACLTGLRRADLAKLGWSHVTDAAIVMPTGKSRGRRNTIVPLIGDTKTLLDEIRTQQATRHAELCATAAKKRRPAPPISTTVLSNTRGTPWTPDGLEHQVIDTKTTAGIDKHLHDARGTFGTRLRKAGLTAPEIADVLAWEEDRVERLLATYVDQEAIVLALAKRIEQSERRSAKSGKTRGPSRLSRERRAAPS